MNTGFTFFKHKSNKDTMETMYAHILSLKKETPLEKFYKKIRYFKKQIYPNPPKLPIDTKFYPLEKTHFYIKEYKKIKDILMKNKNNGIYHFNKQKYSLHGNIINDEEKVYFKIYFYKVKPNKYIIEFQRRNGCPFTWYKHYNEMKKQIILFI